MNERGYSIRNTLVIGLLTIFTVIVLLSGWTSYRDARIEANELFDAKLAHSARLLKALISENLIREELPEADRVVELWSPDGVMRGEDEQLITIDGHAYETKLSFQVWRDATHLLLRSANAPVSGMAPLTAGFQTLRIDGRRWRCFTITTDDGHAYQTCEDRAIRAELARDIAIGVAIPALVALPITGLLVWIFVGFGCRMLSRVAQQVQARSPEHLQPVDMRAVPREIAALVQSINALLQRLHLAMDREKRFTADAAHELRTPLAGIKLHAQNLSAARNEDERAASTRGLLTGIERSERLVSQMLELARMDDELPLTRKQRLDLRHVAMREIAQLSQAQPAQALRLSLDAAPGIEILGDEFLLGLLLRNLLDNALRYSAGPVEIRLEQHGSAASLQVQDHGPGIAASARGRVFERFHREMGTQSSGSGLGLSIVQRIAQLHGAAVELSDTAGGGLTVAVRGLGVQPTQRGGHDMQGA